MPQLTSKEGSVISFNSGSNYTNIEVALISTCLITERIETFL